MVMFFFKRHSYAFNTKKMKKKKHFLNGFETKNSKSMNGFTFN